ncbi:hypothetical protein BDW42DRAFT_170185 [Aspergillus taichungensis]|uniref:Uncharacterized protein n=1 Tax=Aspergillus taichungensis TaxID=482145 RepID=A0A2J5HTZ0_9EURO|nr:hypothetical protein BDW42DRAFT_170185 [Aspergillus taichungensis]
MNSGLYITYTRGFFSAQDDRWNIEWRRRSGFPPLDYKANWEELREVSSLGPVGENQDLTPALGLAGSIGRGYHNIIKTHARAYMDSFPAPDNSGTNVADWKLKRLLQRERYDEEVLVYLNDVLDYRASVITMAMQRTILLPLRFSSVSL